jgi:hypothetical protein
MKPKVYPALERAIESGAMRAWRRAFKNYMNPIPELTGLQEALLVEAITKTVLEAICEDFHLDIPHDDE